MRISRLIGNENVELLKKRSVTLVGLGAVGGHCLDALARSGVGRFTIVDFDTVSESNINRQMLALHSTVGKKKTDVAYSRVMDINPNASVKAIDAFADESNHGEIFEGADLVIDCIDSLDAKISLLAAASRNGITVISSMGAALRKDPSLIRIADVYDTWGCPLARQVRNRLRKLGVPRGIDAVFSPEKVEFEYRNPADDEDRDPDEEAIGKGRKRLVLGSLPTITAIFGETMAHLALRKLLPDVLP